MTRGEPARLSYQAYAKKHGMISRYVFQELIANQIPSNKTRHKGNFAKMPILKTLQYLANYTKRKVADHDFNMVRQSFHVADEFCAKGNSFVKYALENIYVFSFFSMMVACSREEQKTLQAFIPVRLYAAYL